MPRKLGTLAIVLFFAAHALSLFAFYHSTTLRELIVALALVAGVIAGIRNINYLTVIVLLELLVGSSGSLFELNDISIRLLLLVVLLALSLFNMLKEKKIQLRRLDIAALTVVACGAVVALHGYYAGHYLGNVIADSIPLLFLLLYIPLAQLIREVGLEKFDRYLYTGVVAAAWAYAAGALVIYIIYATGAAQLQASLYDWLRQWLAAKITFIGDNRYRIVTPAFLLLSALTPWVLLVTQRLKRSWLLVTPFIVLPALHLTRGLILAILVSLCVLAVTHATKQGVRALAFFVCGLVVCFMTISMISSRGTNWGVDVLSGKAASIAYQTQDQSVGTRRMRLGPITDAIRAQPVFGFGSGFILTYADPYLHTVISTPHLDWGYLEVMLEWGVALTLVLMTAFGYILYRAYVSDTEIKLLSVSVAVVLMTSELVMQSILHVFGMSLIALCIAHLVAKRT